MVTMKVGRNLVDPLLTTPTRTRRTARHGRRAG